MCVLLSYNIITSVREFSMALTGFLLKAFGLCMIAHSFVPVNAAMSAPFAYEEDWKAWRLAHGRWYDSEAQEMERYLIWLDNMRYIEEHNQNATQFGFTLRMNAFGDVVCTE